MAAKEKEMQRRSERLGTQPIIPLLLKLSVPAIIGMATMSMYNVVDSIYVGHISTDALSALSLAFPIQIILIAISVGTGVGTSSLISRLLGMKKPERANNVAEHVFVVIFIYGALVAVVGALFSDDLLRLFTTERNLIEMGQSYIRIVMMGSTALFFPMLVNNIFRGEGNTFVPMLTLIIGAVLNIILDPFLIFGIGFFPRLGVAGAAYATVFSRMVSGVFIGYLLFRGDNQIKLHLRDFKFDPEIIKEIYRVGFPAMVMQLLGSFTIAGVNKILAQYNVLAVAVMGIYFRLQSFVFMPVFGLNQGYMPIIGYNYGHGNPERMKQTMKYGFLIGFLFATSGFVLFQLFSEQLVMMFNRDPELIRIGSMALRRISLAYPIIGLAIVGSTTFQALGRGFPSLVISALRMLVILLPTMYVLGKVYGLSAVWFAFPLSELFTAVVMFFWLSGTLRRVFARMEGRENLEPQGQEG